MSIAENIFLGREPLGPLGKIRWSALYAEAQRLLDKLGVKHAPHTRLGDLSIGEQQMVEIAKAISFESKVIIMDEPTDALTDTETERLFSVVRELRDEGRGIVYISHRLREIFEICDDVTVLRDGGYVGELTRRELEPGRIVQMMVGRPLGDFYQQKTGRTRGRPVLALEHVSGGKVRPATLSVHAGEVLGLAGLVGAGRTELARLIFGADRRESGVLRLDGEVVTIDEPLTAIRLGIGYLPEDRKGQGLFLQLSALANTAINVVGQHSRAGIIDHPALNALTQAAIARLSIKVGGPDGIVGGLSGGNQQKVLLARWLEIRPKVLILDEPTRGVDVGAKAEIYRIINELAAQGVAILVISSELPEIIGICDRVVVMREGVITGECQGEAINQEHIMTLATHAAQAAA